MILAGKKHNRTAECEADLIRSLLNLRKTVDYLLNLLDMISSPLHDGCVVPLE